MESAGLKWASSFAGAVLGLLATVGVSSVFGLEGFSLCLSLFAFAALGGQLGWCAGFALGDETGEIFGGADPLLSVVNAAALSGFVGYFLAPFALIHWLGMGAPVGAPEAVAAALACCAFGGFLALTLDFSGFLASFIGGLMSVGLIFLAAAFLDGWVAFAFGALALGPFALAVLMSAALKYAPPTAPLDFSKDAVEPFMD